MKFAHIADTHIRNLKYHEEYNVVFDKMYETLRNEKVDYIVHCGDIAHTKTQISPEFVEMAANFFRSLAEIAPTYIIPGNHDGNLKNANRQDSLTPIVDALNLDNLHIIKDSGEVEIDGTHVLNVLSVFDEENWVSPTDLDKINIALYHGSISGVTTDTGWVMDHGEHDINIFKDHDFAFLGDIHKTNQILDTEGRVRYPGSTIQQNHGETNDKGFLLWDIQSKEDFTCKHVQIDNPKPFITVELTKNGRMPKGTSIPAGARLRLVCNHSIPLDKLRRAVDIAKTRFTPTSITFLNKAVDRGSVEELTNSLAQEDLRDPAVQEGLISKFLKDYEIEDETLQRVVELNKKYSSVAESEEVVKRNINWRLRSLEWDNLFNYGEGNRIDFTDAAGIVGVFGKNFSGKSSIIDSLLYTLYNNTSKGNRKNLNTINQDKEWGRGKVEIEIGDNVLTVERRSEKYTKRLKGEETTEAKTDVDFSVKNTVTGEVESLNGLDRNGTDKNIRKFFGTIEDFFLTSMASQLDSLTFIGEGSTRRKEILAKFLDLEVFEKKYRLAKEDAADLRGAIKRLEEIEFEEVIAETDESLDKNHASIQKQESRCNTLKLNIESLGEQLQNLETAIESIPAKIINIDEVTSSRDAAMSNITRLSGENRSLGKKAKSAREMTEKIEVFLETFDLAGCRQNQNQISEVQTELEELVRSIKRHEVRQKVEEKKIELLEQVPCGSEFSHCKFIRDAYAALENVGVTKADIESLATKREAAEDKLVQLNPSQVSDHLEKYDLVVKKRDTLESELTSHHLQIAQNKTSSVRLKSEVKELDAQIKEYEDNREAIENLEAHMEQRDALVVEVDKEAKSLERCESKIVQLYKERGSLEQRSQDIKEQEKELELYREQYASSDLFQQCMHSNGISLDIIKNKLPVLNEEIASVLANIVDFDVYLQCDTKHLEIFIKHPKYEPRPLEMGSGAEKTIASMAIRMALLNVSSMPKGDTFILDEPGTALDEENMEGFVRILDLIKANFKTVLLISHLDSLKDAVDSQIVIDKKKGLAYVNQ
jgi:DNA repair exonuclease SbcCD ATPase subunit/DNA repair exonuclease SbcCD nuclease subunit